MTFDECIDVLRQEIRVLSAIERKELEETFDSKEGNRIFMKLEPYEQSGRLSSPEFKEALKSLYWLSR